MNSFHLSQVFGGDKANEEVSEADIVSAVEFSPCGGYLAAGDKGGRIVLFQKDDSKDKARKVGAPGCKLEFKFFCEFQSHEPEFDYLKSLEIEEKINKVRFLPKQNDSIMLLTTNDKTVKLWKVFDKKIKDVVNAPIEGELFIPKMVQRSTLTSSQMRKSYPNAHTYHINSISLNCDMNTFLSADDLRVNIWDLSINDTCFNVVDIKPPNMDDLSEVITCAEFSPNDSSVFVYATSKSVIRLNDLRVNSLCDKPLRSFEDEEESNTKSFFNEIISSISDVKFIKNGKYLLARDYLSVKIWDVAMNKKPIHTFKFHEHLRPKLCDLYENDCIFDKFECSANGTGDQIVTGSYHRYLHVYDVNTFMKSGESGHTVLQANRLQPKPVKRKTAAGTTNVPVVKGKKRKDIFEEMNPDSIDYGKKVLHLSFHPTENLIAVSAVNNLFIFTS